MNKQAIQNTAIAYWCEEDDCFIVQSPLMDSIIGAGSNVEEAQREFNDILSDAYQAYLEGRMSSEKPGRPTKNRIPLNTDVKHETRQEIKRMSAKFNCSQGEVIDYLLAFHGYRAAAEINIPNKTMVVDEVKLSNSKEEVQALSTKSPARLSAADKSAKASVNFIYSAPKDEPTLLVKDSQAPTNSYAILNEGLNKNDWIVRIVKLQHAKDELNALDADGWRIFAINTAPIGADGLYMVITAAKLQ